MGRQTILEILHNFIYFFNFYRSQTYSNTDSFKRGWLKAFSKIPCLKDIFVSPKYSTINLTITLANVALSFQECLGLLFGSHVGGATSCFVTISFITICLAIDASTFLCMYSHHQF